MPYLNGVYVNRATYEAAFPPRAVQLDRDEAEADADAPQVVRRGGESVPRPTNRPQAVKRGRKKAALVAAGVNLPDGIQLPEDGIVPAVAQTNSGGVVANDATLDDPEETE